MVNVENLIVKGKYCIPGKFEHIKEIKNILTRYMSKKYYEPEDFKDIFFIDGFLTLNFRMFLGKQDIPLIYQIKKAFHLISDTEIQTQLYMNRLKNLRPEYPFEIRICLSSEKIGENQRIIINITSIPAIYYKIVQVNKNLYVDNFDYTNIAYTNTEFIKEIMGAISATPLEEPKAMSQYVKSEVSKKLLTFKFNKVAKLLEDGKSNIEIGKSGIGELLGVIENFLFELVSRISDKPAQLHQPERNIDKLKSLDYISEEIRGSLHSALFIGVYRKLKDKDHKKIEMNYYDLKLYYNIVEDIIDFLINRVSKYKIKVKNENE